VGGLEEPRLGAPRIGEGTALEAKQFGFEQRLGDCRAVDVDERPPGSGATLVEDTGDDALAGPGLALDEHGRPSASWATTNEPRDLPPHGFDGWALADQVSERGHRVAFSPKRIATLSGRRGAPGRHGERSACEPTRRWGAADRRPRPNGRSRGA
jgi:hypothetical protein